MQTNYTLKQAVKTAITLLVISAQTNVFALGLGNVEVSSQLGQPLRASIKVQGASELKNVDCFRVINDGTADNQLSNANFKLSKVVDDVAILTVTTSQVLNDPITNLSIAADCNANMRRDYVLLLDPPLTISVENNVDINTISETVLDNEKTDAADITQDTPKIVKAEKATKTAKKSKKVATITTKKDIVLTAGYGEPKPAAVADNIPKAPTNTLQPQNKPRLSISGGEMSAMPSNNPKLRMDMQLAFTPENAPMPLQNALANETDMQDEVAVMNNRMAHLKNQMAQLAKTNQTLSEDNQLKSEQIDNVSRNQFDWLGYILGGALVFSSLSIANKWRLRRQEKLFEDTQFALATEQLGPLDELSASDSFFDFDKDQAFTKETEDTTQHFDIDDAQNDALFLPTIAESPFNTDNTSQFSVEEFNDQQNILDHADVFLSHGRTSLAIQLLQNHLIEHPKKSVTEWLFLLDLLAKDNMQAIYEQTALECKEHFNIRIAAFSNDEDSDKKNLEDFPRLIAGLEQVWGTAAAQVFLDDLIYNSRLETRVGFEKTVLEELLMLKSIAHDATSTAQVIQLDDKKLELKAQKEAKLAADKEDRIKKVNDLIEQKVAETRAQEVKDKSEDMFEFNLAEFN